MWQSPVFDRSPADLEYAKAQLALWKNSKPKLPMKDLKAALNHKDLNRIEGNIQYLVEELTTLCYAINAPCKSWEAAGLPNTQDIARIIGNVEKILSTFCRPADSPTLPKSLVHYEDVNAVEKNLELLLQSFELAVRYFRKCGTMQSGGSALPLKRR